MIPVIARQGCRAYLASMASALLRFMALISLLLMPAAMAGGPAIAQPVPVGAGHCDEKQEPTDTPAKPQAQCASCTAVPPLDVSKAKAATIPNAQRLVTQIKFVAGIELEVSTPPPKLF